MVMGSASKPPLVGTLITPASKRGANQEPAAPARPRAASTIAERAASVGLAVDTSRSAPGRSSARLVAGTANTIIAAAQPARTAFIAATPLAAPHARAPAHPARPVPAGAVRHTGGNGLGKTVTRRRRVGPARPVCFGGAGETRGARRAEERAPGAARGRVEWEVVRRSLHGRRATRF